MSRIYLGNTLIEAPYYGSDFVNDIAVVTGFNIQYIIVAGGGGGGFGGPGGGTTFNTLGGGGGAGGAIIGATTLDSGSYSVIIGAKGTSGKTSPPNTKPTNGGNSTFLGLTAIGGGAAGNGATNCSFSSGSIGGSGGGGGSRSDVLGCITAVGTLNQGNSGAQAGGGGGAGTSPVDKLNGGNGIVWLNGQTFAEGGSTVSRPDRTTRGSGGRGGNFFPNPQNGFDGLDGAVLIRYKGIPQATGGTITESGGFTFHTFTSNGTFTY